MVANIIHGNSKALAECALVAIICELFNWQWDVKLHRICRESNKVVDRLAAIIRGRPLGECLFSEPSREVLDLLQQDRGINL
ncbi:hypothetical protein V6N12_032278 [Hibiscus sabdariffa]|uniref:RNase H type-1 domain-containing protein n=1 Tax=Hibiscus sabdariffa TaxID=183260 RepID=A0ABR2CC56_9ROSI